MTQSWLNKILLGTTLTLSLSAITLTIWFIYSKVYAPLFIDATSVANDTQYTIPSTAIDRAKNLQAAKTTIENDELSTLPNPFSDSLLGASPTTAGTTGIRVQKQP